MPMFGHSQVIAIFHGSLLLFGWVGPACIAFHPSIASSNNSARRHYQRTSETEVNLALHRVTPAGRHDGVPLWQRKSSTILYSSKSNKNRDRSESAMDVDGQGRGQYIMGLVLFLCIWIFSIPPDFRRAHICTSSNPPISRSDCESLGDWISRVGEYYKQGGGIQFDFTIDQSTKDFWAGKNQ